ncbi:MAG: hypothetical protein ACK5LJ_15140, partial [Paracoccus sp. (in: a-proteobacteria)]
CRAPTAMRRAASAAQAPMTGTHDWHAKGRINVIGALLAGMLLSIGLSEAIVDADIADGHKFDHRICAASVATAAQNPATGRSKSLPVWV